MEVRRRWGGEREGSRGVMEVRKRWRGGREGCRKEGEGMWEGERWSSHKVESTHTHTLNSHKEQWY